MKKLASLVMMLLVSQAVGAQCESVSIHENYSVRRTINSEDELNNPDFINSMKEQLINQISSFVDSSVSITSSKKKRKKLRSEKTTDKSSNVASVGILNDPTIMFCNNVVIMSINKEEYKKKQYSYFSTKLETYAGSLKQLLNIGSIDDKKFLDEMIETYNHKVSEISSLLPLVDLLESEREILMEFTSNFNLLKTKEAEIRYNKRAKIQGRLSTIGKKLSKVADLVAPVDN